MKKFEYKIISVMNEVKQSVMNGNPVEPAEILTKYGRQGWRVNGGSRDLYNVWLERELKDA